ncbi:unnamed protein product [Cylicostephanus goldi]|uniref:Dynein assembly factor 1, axonemal homolog n=1 Tax=Cylicostephanus goldi TaxID=71465 RepID=A0A3P7MNP5_CYLGO|nr:unnamed protein product [Cylicostephanus goldi]
MYGQSLRLCSLELLELADNRIGKIENLEELTGLKKLFLGANQITVIEGLSTLKELTVLSFIGNAIRDIEGLSTLTKLMDLSIAQNGITRIAGLVYLKLSLKNPENLAIGFVKTLFSHLLSDLFRLTNNLALSCLDLNDNRIEKIENLQHLVNLRSLWIRKNKIANWSEVAYLNRLPLLRDVAFEMNPIYSTQHFYRNRIREILPKIKIIDGFPARWITGDPWQELSEGSEGSCA